MTEFSDGERVEIRKEFREVVNMSPRELERWLDTEESARVGDTAQQGDLDAESTGHASGRRIVELKRKRVDALTDDDHEHMRKVVGYVHRHLAQPSRSATGR